MILGPVIGSSLYIVGGFITPFIAMGSMNLLVSILIVFVLKRISVSNHSIKAKDSNQPNVTVTTAVKVR